jgi:diphosphomevalonate decarboxylase
VSLAGEVLGIGRYAPFFDGLRSSLRTSLHFETRSINSFPTAAGLASSSSGFAALAGACARVAGREPTPSELSALARVGSASAARSIFGGFVLLPAGSRFAEQVFDARHWPSLRIVIAIVRIGRKPVSSREAMFRTTATSPYYREWVSRSRALLPDALSALGARDLEKLGDIMLASYSMMHAAMLAARPPIMYWLPTTIAVIHACRDLRSRGTGAWETIDAGPQVKVLCEDERVDEVIRVVKESAPGIETLTCFPGEGVSLTTAERPEA